MQGQAHAALLQRFLYYWGRDYVGQLGAGQSYSDLATTSSIFILNFRLLPTRRYHSVFRLLEVHERRELLEDLELHFLELPKLSMLHATANEPDDPILGQAKEALERLSADPVAQRLASDRERDELAHKFILYRTREEGRAEGREEGRAEAVSELLRELLVIKFGELPEAVEARLALADQAERRRWAERVLTATSLDEVLD